MGELWTIIPLTWTEIFRGFDQSLRQKSGILLLVTSRAFHTTSLPFIYLNINQLDALNFIMSLFHASTCFEHMCLSSGGQNCTVQSLVSSH